jgi:hypothetical protein
MAILSSNSELSLIPIAEKTIPPIKGREIKNAANERTRSSII